MDPDAGAGHMIPQRRLPAGRHAPRHAPRHAFAPHLTATARANNTSRIGHPNSRGTLSDFEFGEGRGGPTDSNPPKHPQRTTLMLHRHEANSRFLTDCYLFPAAVWSAPRPKLGRAKPSRIPGMQAGAPM